MVRRSSAHGRDGHATGWVVAFLLLLAHAAQGETLAARDLALKSGGAEAPGGAWSLDSGGFVGTYVHFDVPGEATVRLAADAAARITIADHTVEASDAGPHRLPLPAGTFFVRVQPVDREGRFTVHSVTIDGAAVLNAHTDANALAAADTYIANFRRGEVTVRLDGIAPGTPVRVKLVRRAFNFGTNCPGVVNRWMVENPPPGSDEQRFQQFILGHFNMLVPSNAGKWVYHEPEPGQVQMEYADAILAFARKHGLRARMHALIWDTEQQPAWARELLTRALGGDARAKDELRRSIGDRIRYYVGDRAARYDELDVLNESLHRDGYWKLLGPAGMAEIYNEVARSANDANPNLRLYLNEYNVLQWSRRYPFTESDEPDPYANWYREHVEELIRAGGAVSGIGVQYYVDPRPESWEKSPHSPARISAVMQNLSTVGLPITLTEFGIRKEATPEQAAEIYDQTMRLVYGTPQATGFLVWGFWAGAVAEKDLATALVDGNWNVTPAGRAYEGLMTQWGTDVTLNVSDDGSIRLTGYFGDYEITAGNMTFRLRLTKGTTDYRVRAE
jgi:endo-1,4-beta-xylanase